MGVPTGNDGFKTPSCVYEPAKAPSTNKDSRPLKSVLDDDTAHAAWEDASIAGFAVWGEEKGTSLILEGSEGLVWRIGEEKA